jgi:hypothetical protein
VWNDKTPYYWKIFPILCFDTGKLNLHKVVNVSFYFAFLYLEEILLDAKVLKHIARIFRQMTNTLKLFKSNIRYKSEGWKPVLFCGKFWHSSEKFLLLTDIISINIKNIFIARNKHVLFLRSKAKYLNNYIVMSTQ